MSGLLAVLAVLAGGWAQVGEAIRTADAVGVVAQGPPVVWIAQHGPLVAPQWLPGSTAPTDLVIQTDGRLSQPLSRAVPVPAGEARATQRFLVQWRTEPTDPDRLLQLLGSSASIARRIAFASLQLSGQRGYRLSHAGIEQVARLLIEPNTAWIDQRDALRVLEHAGGAPAADRLAELFAQLTADRLRAAAAGVLARWATPTAQRALIRCAREDRPLPRRRCLRLIEHLRVPKPRLTPGHSGP